MKLYYFDIKDSPDVLKSKRNALIKKHHPDKAPEHQKAAKTEIMKRINAEYEFLTKEHKHPQVQEKFKQSKSPLVNKEATEQAQNIFHAITNLDTINYLLLISTVTEIKNWKEVSDIYTRMYGVSTLKHLKKVIPSKELEKMLRIIISTL